MNNRREGTLSMEGTHMPVNHSTTDLLDSKMSRLKNPFSEKFISTVYKCCADYFVCLDLSVGVDSLFSFFFINSTIHNLNIYSDFNHQRKMLISTNQFPYKKHLWL